MKFSKLLGVLFLFTGLLLPQSVCRAGVDAKGYPVFAAGEILTTEDPATQGVRIICTHHGMPRSWGIPLPDERHGNFDIEFNEHPERPLEWTKVGFILVQFIDHEKSLDRYGRHLRIREIEVSASHQKRGIATRALKILMASYQPVRFERFKAEISEFNGASLGLFTKLGFAQQAGGGVLDVGIYLLAKPGAPGEGKAMPAAEAKDELQDEAMACASCGLVPASPKQCSQCRKARYCGPVCQKKHCEGAQTGLHSRRAGGSALGAWPIRVSLGS